MDFASIAPWMAAGGSFGGVVLGVKWLIEWLSNRSDQNHSNMKAKRDNLDAGMTALIEALQKQVAAQDLRIDRIEEENKELRKRIEGQRDREVGLEDENKELREQVKALEHRLDALEALFKTMPVSPELQAQIDRIDTTAPRRRGKK